MNLLYLCSVRYFSFEIKKQQIKRLCLGAVERICFTFSAHGFERVDVVFIHKLLFQDHLHSNDDLSHYDQQVTCEAHKQT